MQGMGHAVRLFAAATLVGAIAVVTSAGCGSDYIDGTPGPHLKRPGASGCGDGPGQCPCTSGNSQQQGFCAACPVFANGSNACVYCRKDAFCSADPCFDAFCPASEDEVTPTDCPDDAPIGCAGNFCCPRDYPICCDPGFACAKDANGCEAAVQ